MQPLATDTITTNTITRYFRIGRILVHTLAGMLIASLVLPLASKSFRLRLIKWWCRRLLAAFNLRVISQGHIPLKNASLRKTMFVANHISWTDIHALNSVVTLRFIAKSEIKTWPVFGYLANRANALFIDRSKRQDAARIVDTAALSLEAGDNLCFFPEGTTTDGTEIRPFKSSLVQAAIQANATIWPVAIRYPCLNGSTNTGVAYAGETTMLESIQQILSQKHPVVELHFLAPIPVTELADKDKDRRALTLHIEYLIRNKLDL
ncbi:MAG: lysophospholipid acyltransferase family protein [Methylotenera sp.]